MTNEANALLMGGGGKSASFKEHGDAVMGEVISMESRQQTDFTTSEPLVWEDGKPRMQVVVTLQTPDQEDDDDDGIRRIFVKVPSQMLAVIRQAVRQAGSAEMEEGGVLTVKYVSDAKPTKRGLNGQKQYEAAYRPPTRSMRLPDDNDDDLPF